MKKRVPSPHKNLRFVVKVKYKQRAYALKVEIKAVYVIINIF